MQEATIHVRQRGTLTLAADIAPWTGCAHPKDLPIWVATLGAECPWLVTFHLRHYQPGHPDLAVMRPGAFLQRVRSQLARLGNRP